MEKAIELFLSAAAGRRRACVGPGFAARFAAIILRQSRYFVFGELNGYLHGARCGPGTPGWAHGARLILQGRYVIYLRPIPANTRVVVI